MCQCHWCQFFNPTSDSGMLNFYIPNAGSLSNIPDIQKHQKRLDWQLVSGKKLQHVFSMIKRMLLCARVKRSQYQRFYPETSDEDLQSKTPNAPSMEMIKAIAIVRHRTPDPTAMLNKWIQCPNPIFFNWDNPMSLCKHNSWPWCDQDEKKQNGSKTYLTTSCDAGSTKHEWRKECCVLTLSVTVLAIRWRSIESFLTFKFTA